MSPEEKSQFGKSQQKEKSGWKMTGGWRWGATERVSFWKFIEKPSNPAVPESCAKAFTYQ